MIAQASFSVHTDWSYKQKDKLRRIRDTYAKKKGWRENGKREEGTGKERKGERKKGR
jgi:hypothetical protein